MNIKGELVVKREQSRESVYDENRTDILCFDAIFMLLFSIHAFTKNPKIESGLVFAAILYLFGCCIFYFIFGFIVQLDKHTTWNAQSQYDD